MTQIFFRMLIRLSIGLFSLIIYMKILGKMQLAPQSILDQIGNYVLGGIIGGIIYNLDLSLVMFFMAIIIWGGFMLIINYIRARSLKAKRKIDGNPVLLMENEKLKTEEFKNIMMSADSLMSRLHQEGIKTLSDIDTIWLEPNGQLTIVKKDDDDIAYVLIEDGQINDIDMRRSKKTKEWLNKEIKKQGVHNISEIFCAEYLNDKLNIYKY